MRIIAFAASLICLHSSIAVAAQASSGEPIIQMGIFGSRADGSSVSAAYDTEPSLDSRVYASRQLCQLGAGYREVPAWAMHGWRFSGRVVSKTVEEALVQVTWQRTLDYGNDLGLPEHSVQLKVRAGDRVPLDTVAAPPDSPCPVTVSFEVRFEERRGSATRAFGRGGVLSGSAARGPDGTGVGGDRVSTGPGGLSAGPNGDRGSWMQVHLWLVHTAPDRKDEVVHQLVRAPREGADFAFAPISIDTPRGAVVVQVGGSFGIADGQFIFVTNRSLKYLSQAARDSAPSSEGTGRTVNAMPGSADVLSFELPPIPGPGGAAPLPNQLSVRVQMTR